jgi:dipeptide/tripeptide permease
MTIPIYVFALVMTVIVAFWSDRKQQRTPFIMFGFSIALVGFTGMLVTRRYEDIPGVSYFFLFLVAAGLYSPFICIVCLIGNNLAPSSKRAVGMALLISMGNLGGICGSNIYLAAQAPRYPAGFGTGMGMSVAAIVMAYVLRKAYKKENAKRDAFMVGKTDAEVRAMYSEQELLDLGDKSPFYRYTV